MAQIIIRNESGGTLELEDFGVFLPNGEIRELHEEFGLYEILSSQQLKDLVTTGDLIVNNGETDLNAEDGVKHLTLQTQYDDESDDPSQSGGWSIGETPPADPKNGDGWYNTDHGALYTFNAPYNVWLTSRFQYHFALKGNCKNKYLEAYGHTEPEGHIYIHRDIALLHMHGSVQCAQNNVNAGVSPEANYQNLADLVFPTTSKAWVQNDSDVFLTIDRGQRFQMYAWSNKRIKHCFVTVEAAWRIEP